VGGDTNGNRHVRVLIAHSARLHRDAVRAALDREADLEVVAEVANAADAVEACLEVHPDVAILDALLPDYASVQPGCAIRDRNGVGCRILVVAEASDLATLTDGLGCGARGYLTHDASIADLVEAVRTVARGETLIPPPMLGPLLNDLLERRRDHEQALMRLADLSPREREVLGLLARGMRTSAIAEELVISPETARTHAQNILTKLGLHSRLEAATFVIENGLLDHLRPTARQVETAS
jgi:DNA-binding NarL/FixJ family response regulator